jgi:hypothetical protein
LVWPAAQLATDAPQPAERKLLSSGAAALNKLGRLIAVPVVVALST